MPIREFASTGLPPGSPRSTATRSAHSTTRAAPSRSSRRPRTRTTSPARICSAPGSWASKGKSEDAVPHLDKAEALLGSAPDPTDLAQLRVEQAKVAAHAGDGDTAVARAREAIETLGDTYEAEQGSAWWALAEGLALQGDVVRGRQRVPSRRRGAGRRRAFSRSCAVLPPLGEGSARRGSRRRGARRAGAGDGLRSPQPTERPRAPRALTVTARIRPAGPYSLPLTARGASDATRVWRDGVLRAVVGDEQASATQLRDGTVVVQGPSEASVEAVALAPRRRRRPLRVPAALQAATSC